MQQVPLAPPSPRTEPTFSSRPSHLLEGMLFKKGSLPTSQQSTAGLRTGLQRWAGKGIRSPFTKTPGQQPLCWQTWSMPTKGRGGYGQPSH